MKAHEGLFAFETASAEKQRIAEEVASMLKLKVELNSTSSERFFHILCFILLFQCVLPFVIWFVLCVSLHQ